MNNNLWVTLLFSAALLLAGCGGIQLGHSPASQTVKYEVKSYYRNVDYGIADLTYENETGGTQQESSVALPWTRSFQARRGAFLYISAQSTYPSDVTVTVNIYVNGVLVKHSESKGVYVIATASGTLLFAILPRAGTAFEVRVCRYWRTILMSAFAEIDSHLIKTKTPACTACAALTLTLFKSGEKLYFELREQRRAQKDEFIYFELLPSFCRVARKFGLPRRPLTDRRARQNLFEDHTCAARLGYGQLKRSLGATPVDGC